MINRVYISTLLLLVVHFVGFSQVKNKYCIYDQVALEKYGDGDFESAKTYIDSALLMCDELKSDPYAYHIQGFTYFNLYKAQQLDDPYSEYRSKAFHAFLKSNEFDQSGEFREKNNVSLRNICIRIQNDIARSMDTLNYKEALKLNNLYHEYVSLSGVSLDLQQHDISFNNMIGNIYVQLFNNNKEGRRNFVDSAATYYNKALALDTLGFEANKNLGYLYHNLSIDIILNMDPEDDILTMYEKQEESSKLGLQSLPYLKRAHEMRPKNKTVLYGLAGIYFMLHETEKSDFYRGLYDQLSKESDGEDLTPPNNDN